MSKFNSIFRLFSKSEKQTTPKNISFYTSQRKKSGVCNPDATLIEVIDPIEVLPTDSEVVITPHFFISESKVL